MSDRSKVALWNARAASWAFWRSSLSLVGKVPDTEKADAHTYTNIIALASYESSISHFSFDYAQILPSFRPLFSIAALPARNQSLDPS